MSGSETAGDATPETPAKGGGESSGGPLSGLLNTEAVGLLPKRDRLAIMAGALVVVPVLAFIAAAPASGAAVYLALFAMAVVAGLAGLVYVSASRLDSAEAGLVSRHDAAETVNGHWWQIVHAENHPGLSYVRIRFTALAEQNVLFGIGYDETGRRRSRFSSDAIAVRATTPIEIYYFWAGSVLETGSRDVVHGAGWFRFDGAGPGGRPWQAEGAFTEGRTGLMEFGPARIVELIRFTDAEERALAADERCLDRLAKAAFERFGLEPNRQNQP